LTLLVALQTRAQRDTSKWTKPIWNGYDSISFSKPSKADVYFENGEYILAAQEYKNIISEDKTDKVALYNLAATYSLAQQKDSAFKYLYIATKKDSFDQVLADPDFYNLSLDKRWEKFERNQLQKIESDQEKKDAHPDLTLQLWRMNRNDQAFYRELFIYQKKYGMKSNKVDSIWKIKTKLNEQNISDLEKMISEHGWPKISDVGVRAASTAFLIIQHSDEKRQKKYLPGIEALCKINEADWQDYALMKDRVLISDNKPQIYGSQVKYNETSKKYELFPIEDEEHVDERRLKVGLPALKIYLKEFGIEYQFKKNKD
jgi:hypothetical protein